MAQSCNKEFTVAAHSDMKFTIPGEYYHMVDGSPVLYAEPAFYGKETQIKLESFDLQSDDIVVAAYPKSGTIWINEAIFLILSQGDVEAMKKRDYLMVVPFLELLFNDMSHLELLGTLDHPWHAHTHLYPQLLRRQIHENKAKFVHVLRNPKDVLVSWYHFYRCNLPLLFPGTWDEFFELYREKKILFGDVLDHNLAWWKLRSMDNILILKYEDLRRDPSRHIQRLARFLGKTLSQDELDIIVDATSFKNMKATYKEETEAQWCDLAKGSFFRKGEIGDWKNYFNAEQSQFIDNIYKTRMIPEGLEFDFE